MMMNASTIEEFKVEVFNKIVGVLELEEVFPSGSEDQTDVEIRIREARQVTREVLLDIQTSISYGTLIFMGDEELPKDAMQAVITDALRLVDESLNPSSPVLQDESRSFRPRRKGKMARLRGFFRRAWKRMKRAITRLLCIRARPN